MKRKRNGLFYSKKEETINSISHGIGIAMGVIVRMKNPKKGAKPECHI